jgi:hypothetical protein
MASSKLSYLIFLKRLDDAENRAERLAKPRRLPCLAERGVAAARRRTKSKREVTKNGVRTSFVVFASRRFVSS